MKTALNQYANRRIHARGLAIPALASLLGISSCSAPGPVPSDQRERDLQGVRKAEATRPLNIPAAGEGDQRAALLNGAPIYWEDLQPALAEASGAQALQEAVLDRLLSERLHARGLMVTNEDIAAERTLLVASVAQSAAAGSADAERLLDQVRRTRGLGERRFARLLARNAQMRKLVAPGITVSEEEIHQAFEIAHGPKYRARVILLPTVRQAAQLRESLLAGADNLLTSYLEPSILSVRFADAASRQSTDPSASRGGLLEPISPADPSYPSAARETLRSLKPGQISPVIAVDRGGAIFLLEESIPADVKTLADSANRISAEIRTRRERLAMDDLARDLLRSANLNILDRGLDWSWRNTLGAGTP